MSVWTIAIVPAMSAVTAPVTATTHERGLGLVEERARAAPPGRPGGDHGRGVIRALTGVGPSIASGSQTWSGICALLPVAPDEQQQARERDRPHLPSASGTSEPALSADLHEVETAEGVRVKSSPRIRPASPTRFTTNALRPAAERAVLAVPEADQQGRSRGPPLPSQMNNSGRLPPITSSSMKKTNRLRWRRRRLVRVGAM